MHYLTRQRLHLSRFHPLMKALLTLYVLSVLVALWVATLKYTDRATWSAEGVAELVSGSEEDALLVKEGMSRRELVDIVHPHLFTVPIVIFILGHLLHLTRLPDALKLTVNAVAMLSTLATFLLPFLVLDRPGLSGLLYASGTAMLLSFLVLCVVPLWEMWIGRPPQGEGFDALPRQGP